MAFAANDAHQPQGTYAIWLVRLIVSQVVTALLLAHCRAAPAEQNGANDP
jgi:hypothetical protein